MGRQREEKWGELKIRGKETKRFWEEVDGREYRVEVETTAW